LKILVLLGSVRRGRQSNRVATYVTARLVAAGITAELADLAALDLPIMEERLGRRDDPPAGVTTLGAQLVAADGIIVVSPEYNHGYPGVLKNALDYYFAQFKRKPVAIVTVSAGGFGGVNCWAQLVTVLNHMGALVSPVTVPISKVQDAFTPEGELKDPSIQKRVDALISELVWLADAVKPRTA
jgi:NAD(P)H-dependent FMN reductase